MKLLVATDAHIFKTPQNDYWCGAIYGYNFWTRYLNVFDDVLIIARVKEVTSVEEKWKRVDGLHVEIFEIPFYQGPKQLIKKYRDIRKCLKNVYSGCDAAIFRMPSPTGQLVWNKRKHFKGPIALEVVYDLTDDLTDSSSNFIEKTISKIQISMLKKACLEANGVSYVTEYTIQNNFPSRAKKEGEGKQYFESYYSTITMNEDAFAGPKDFTENKSYTLVMSDVAMNSYRKGEMTFLKTIKELSSRNYDIRGIIIGDGTKRGEFESFARGIGIDKQVKFTGLLYSPNEVREYLKKSDIFVFPTSAEGLPRGILEAMAVGLPVVSSPVGGIPEVIANDFLAEPTDVDKYVSIIENMISDNENMNMISKKNYQVSKQFCNNILEQRRNEFYKKIKNICK